ncbi:dicarboxylate/amino acid:cation symporter [Dapis sp. BLCC M172]|uniref:dicarboxylate/amino acid:cation symporter n=1 Tax=Hydrocoleum sp. CS-953 TaxID=1671698 RepID=UPI001FEFBD66|nr:cation:dicarboxylase symporter family transporter [Hydrocoleum sp. CS-953]
MRNPWSIVPGILLGLYLGIFQKNLSLILTPYGNLYLELLKMCVLPLLFSAITMSVGRLISSSDASEYVKRILIVFSIGLVGVSTIAAIVTAFTNPGGNLDDSSLTALGVIVNKSELDLEISLNADIIQDVVDKQTTLISFLFNLVPENIFASLSEGNALETLFFSIVFGVAMGYLKESHKEDVFNLLEMVFKSSKKLIDWIILFLPMGLCCLLASQIATTGFGILAAMKNFVIISILSFFIIYIVSTVVVWQKAGCSLWKVLISLKEPTILALATRSSFTCLPSSISALTESLKFDRQTVNLVIPLAITVCRFGPVAYFATTSVFVVQLYNNQLNLSSSIIIIIASILAGMATAGATGILTLTLLDLVLQPLGLPLEAILVLLIAIDPIIDPFRTLGIVHTGIAATAAIADSNSQQSTEFASEPQTLEI